MNAILVNFHSELRLGRYCTINSVPVYSQTKTKTIVTYNHNQLVFNADGSSANSVVAPNGYHYQRLYTLEQAKSLYNGKFGGYRILLGKEILQSL